MTNQEILEKAIQKAIDGGWNKPQPTDAIGLSYVYIDHPEILIFNHDFAKALWGDTNKYIDAWNKGAKNYLNVPALNPENYATWQYHLQQMVTADDPVKYLGENI